MKVSQFPMCVLMISLGCLTSLWACSEAPVSELEATRQTLQKALKDDAPRYAPNPFERAQNALKAAEKEIDAQKLRWAWERDYSAAIELLSWARVDGDLASQEANEIKKRIDNYSGNNRNFTPSINLPPSEEVDRGDLPLEVDEQISSDFKPYTDMTSSKTSSAQN